MFKIARLFHKKQPDEAVLYNALRAISTPDGAGDIVSAGRVSALNILNDQIICVIEIPTADQAAAYEKTRIEAESALKNCAQGYAVQVILTAESAAPAKQDNDTSCGSKASRPAPSPPLPRPDVKHIIAISSGKGGVGKSTVAFNLAIALQRKGHKVGLLDADIYGPSVPRLSGLTEIHYGQSKPDTNAEGKIIPPEAHGLKIMSIGFLIAEESPLIWRGPMVQSAITQLFRDVDWNGLDYLIIDMPPGTGDAQLTLAQKTPPDGAIIVSTPQDLALIDARKGLEMYKKTNIPILGIIENMSLFTCPKCGETSEIFGHGGAKSEANKLGVDFLGAVPLNIDIRMAADHGQPAKDAAFNAITDKVIAACTNDTGA